MNSLLDLQARLRGDLSDPQPWPGDTITVDAPTVTTSEQPPRMSEEAVSPEVSSLESGDTLSVKEAEIGITMSPAPPAEALDLEAAEVPAPPVLQEPDLETPPAPPTQQTREDQIAVLAKRIDQLEQELTFVAEELWRLASEPPRPAQRSV